MNTTETSVELRVLGQFCILQAGKPPARAFPPEPEARALLCNLLSPQGDPVSRDRLCRLLWRVSLSELPEARLVELVRKLNTSFMMEFGIRPIIEKSGGLTFNDTLIRLDARCFYQISVLGLQHLAAGDLAGATRCFKTALTMYGGPLLPGSESRTISTNRECLHSLYLAMEHHVAKLPSSQVRTITTRHPKALAA